MKKSKEMLYITFIDFHEKSETGSSVRPKRMFRAFEEAGYSIKLISGKQNDYRARNNAYKEVKKYLKFIKPDFCYIEPPSGPLFFECDRKIIRTLHQHKIPMGFFYRDIYWKFDSSTFKNQEIYMKDKLKAFVIKYMQKRDYRLLKKCITRFYFPSDSVGKYMGLSNYSVLPPGCIEINCNKKIGNKMQAIYVGGATKRYGIGLILDVWKNIKDITLNIVCPENQWIEWVNDNPIYREMQENINVYHLSDGEKLESLYAEAQLALIPILKTEYNDMAIPIKLFEYTSRLLPIVATNCEEMKKIVEEYEIGIVAEDTVEEFLAAVLEMSKTLKEDSYISKLKAMREANTWLARANKVIDELVGEKDDK